jgi:prohibitin 1
MTRSLPNLNLPPSSGKFLVGGALLLLVALFFRPFAIVNAGERGVVMRLGRVQDGVLDEGFHFILPFVTSVKTMSVRVQRSDIKAQAASKDLQDVTTELALNWHIDPIKVNTVFQRIGDEK